MFFTGGEKDKPGVSEDTYCDTCRAAGMAVNCDTCSKDIHKIVDMKDYRGKEK